MLFNIHWQIRRACRRIWSQLTNGKRLNYQNAARIKKKSLYMIGRELELVEMDLEVAFPLLCPLVLDCIIGRDVSEDSEG